jgi:hypothetical protein
MLSRPWLGRGVLEMRLLDCEDSSGNSDRFLLADELGNLSSSKLQTQTTPLQNRGKCSQSLIFFVISYFPKDFKPHPMLQHPAVFQNPFRYAIRSPLVRK